MTFQPGTSLSVAAFVAILAGVVVAFLFAVHRAYADNAAMARRQTVRAAAGTTLWLGGIAGVVATGVMPHLPMSGLPFFFGAITVVSVGLGVSRLGGRLADQVPLSALVVFQGFRLPLELVLHAWVLSGTIPATMTWTGRNWDILSGIVALVVAPFIQRHLIAAWIANLIGAALLLNVMRVALMSAPVPFGWNVTPPLLVALHLPYALIGPVCVGGALAGHIVLTRALLRRATLT